MNYYVRFCLSELFHVSEVNAMTKSESSFVRRVVPLVRQCGGDPSEEQGSSKEVRYGKEK